MKTLDITQLDYSDPGFIASLDSMLAWEDNLNQKVETRVADIVRGVRQHGDAALLDYTRQFDAFSVDNFAALELSQQRLQQALESVPAPQLAALEAAAGRIRNYHLKQRQDSWQYEEPDGTILGQQVTPVQRVGVYVPGGKAAYPSTVLMNVIPARVAGVEEIIMVVPAPSGILNDLVLAAANIAGVDRVFTIGGAQAIAALAYGTETVPRVDKIVGPGNIYVATAKRQVFGQVGIDMIAGP
jgi:histidinol dehydrogenase